MGRKKNNTSEMDVAEKQATPLASQLADLITDGEALRKHLGVSSQAINQYKLGISRPSLDNLCKIADFYKVSVDYLLGRTGTPSVEEDVQAVFKTTGLSTVVAEWLRSIKDDPARLETLNAILENKTFQAILPHINELKNVQIAVEIERYSDNVTPSREIEHGQYVVGSYEYLSVLEYRIAEWLKDVIDDVTSPLLDELDE